MLTAVEVTTSQGALLTLQLDDASSGLSVQEIEGLDPVKATLVSSSFANMDGAQYHSSRREPRNIKLKLGLEPDYSVDTVRDLRKRLYNFFMPKAEVRLRFIMDDGPDLDILGRIESFDSPLFVKEPAVDISFMCFDPDFKDAETVNINLMSTAALDEQLITYDGTVESGLVFKLFADRDLTQFTIYHRPPDGTLRLIEFAGVITAGDTLTISTSVGEKSVVITHLGMDTQILYALSPQSNWLEFQPGDNYIRVYAVGAAIPASIAYTTKYGGL